MISSIIQHIIEPVYHCPGPLSKTQQPHCSQAGATGLSAHPGEIPLPQVSARADTWEIQTIPLYLLNRCEQRKPSIELLLAYVRLNCLHVQTVEQFQLLGSIS